MLIQLLSFKYLFNMAKKFKYYLVRHMAGPDVVKTNDKRKIKTWLTNLYKDCSNPPDLDKHISIREIEVIAV